jgi:hypothetical protein
MEAINAILRTLIGGLLDAMSALPEWAVMAILAFVVTLIAMPIMKWTFNVDLAERFKRKVYAGLFEIRLFNDRLGATFRGLFNVLRYTGGYLGSWLLPIIVMSIPMAPIFVFIHFHYSYDGVRPGASTVLTAQFAEDRDGGKPPASLTAPAGVEIETPALWIPAQRQLTWRLAAVEPGDYELQMAIDGRDYTKTLVVSGEAARRSPLRPRTSFFQQLIYPAEPPIPADSPLAAITVDYTEKSSFLFVPTWGWILLLFTVPWFLLLKKPFNVEI